MRRYLALLGIAGAIAFAPAAVAGGAIEPTSAALAAKPCSGYTHAVIGGEHKCLRRGQFCAVRYDRQYHRYGFHCHSGRLT